MPDLTLEEVLAKARDDPRIVGVFLGGSRGKGAKVRPDSDYDVRVVIAEEDDELFRELDTERGVPVEVAVMTLEELRGYKEWDRPTLTHTRALVDKTGEIQRLIDERGRLSAAEAERIASTALDGYMNSLYRSLKRPGLGGRIHAGESVGHLLVCLFALEGRVRPFHDYLAWELETHPLEGLPADRLLGLIDRALSGEPAPQRELFRMVEPHVRVRGLGAVVVSWDPDVPFMRGEP
jgi:predicted nucleotidyltransferase